MTPNVFLNGPPVMVIPDFFRGCPGEMRQLREEARGETFFMLEVNGGQRYYAKSRVELEEMVKGELGYRYAITKILGVTK